MKRAITTLGVVGLALFSVSAPAYAGADFKLCHNGSELMIDLHGAGGLAGHTRHSDDIIPPNELLPAGLNWPAQGGDPSQPCLGVTPPVPVVDPPAVVVDPPAVVVDPPAVVVDPPAVVVDPPAVVVDPPAVVEPQTVTAQTPVTLSPAPQAAEPQGAAAKPAAKVPAAAASAVRGTNQGYNAQTAVGGAEESSTWMAGMGLLLGAGAMVAVRRRSRTESPVAS